MKFLLSMIVVATALVGCSNDTDSGTDNKEPATSAPGTKGSLGEAYKADCLNCTPDGPNAFVQLGIGDRFWKVGDSWQVVYELHTDTRVQMQEQLHIQEGGVKAPVGLVVLDFNVIESGTHTTGDVDRDTVIIKITQGFAQGSLSEAIAGKTVEIDELTAQINLEIDDLLRPVAVTEFSGPRGQFPNGQTLQIDPRDALRNLDSAFPYVVPNAYIGAEKTELPLLSDELAQVAQTTRQDFKSAQYFHFDMKGKGLESAENVYWRGGDLWPYLVQTPYATGVLVNQIRQ